MNLLTKIFGTKHDRDIKKMMPTVEEINALEPEMEQLSNDGLRERLQKVREQVQERLKPIYEEEKRALEEPPEDGTEGGYSNG